MYYPIMKAADSIEEFPELFRYSTDFIPDPGCGTPGCAIGWIAAHKPGYTGNSIGGWTGEGVLGMPSGEFYERMTELGGYGWRSFSGKCAETLRLYAEKYHADERVQIPQLRLVA